jgi:hypothetical protein
LCAAFRVIDHFFACFSLASLSIGSENHAVGEINSAEM